MESTNRMLILKKILCKESPFHTVAQKALQGIGAKLHTNVFVTSISLNSKEIGYYLNIREVGEVHVNLLTL